MGIRKISAPSRFSFGMTTSQFLKNPMGATQDAAARRWEAALRRAWTRLFEAFQRILPGTLEMFTDKNPGNRWNGVPGYRGFMWTPLVSPDISK